MLVNNETPYRKPISDGLILGSASSVDDVERIAQFNGVIHGPGIVSMTRNIFLNHPDTCGSDLIYVEDTKSGQIVSSLCLIPWRLSYGAAQFNSGEMGIVGTLEPYRRRGLIRAQVDIFKQRLKDRECVLSHIQSIGYYYRQFGYEYAMPLEGGLIVTRRNLAAPATPSYNFRLAIMEDIPTLIEMADQAATDITIHTVRSTAIWRYLMGHSVGTEMESEVWLAQNPQAQIVGYMRLPKHHFGEELTVSEASRMDFDTAVAGLHFLVQLAEERSTPGVRLCLPANTNLMRVARSFGARDIGAYAWQVHVPDIAALLRAIGPELERRLSESMFAGLTRDIELGFYRQTVKLAFTNGRLTEVSDLGFTDGAAIRFPANAFTPLVLGHHSLSEVLATYPDAGVPPAYRLLMETLFPKVQAFLYTIY
ncbi:MAG: GNAT family N-acetyltransferase [Chloroflexi bacterium]|nr:GNAT family N-acetyltransferase [Chloroflexota bacterium]MCL5273733.1 GNAT family N-acetyltransferase [Chloroflexota bacterium]